MQQISSRLNGVSNHVEIRIASGVRRRAGEIVKQLGSVAPKQVVVISNRIVLHHYGAETVESLRRKGCRVATWSMPDGERHKSFNSLERAVTFLAQNRLERNDVVVALGGGVVGDLAGFAAAIYLRGLPLIQLPTTLLAQVDSSVGGKTAINLPFGKNLVGAFHQPAAVLIDPETLRTLPARELTSGCCEMVKQGAVASARLFSQTVSFLRKMEADRDWLTSATFEKLIASHCRFKSSIVAHDERELIGRADVQSRKILNFGHTTAHALETVTGYRYFRHGEAVGYGVLVAGEISKSLGLLDAPELESLREAVRLCGPLPRTNHLHSDAILAALKHDKKRIGGAIKWVLLRGLGSPLIVDGAEVSARLLRTSLERALWSS
ncbi:MAG: 3-dehydroquinate synthase [Pyrinomonadaceae bacterium]